LRLLLVEDEPDLGKLLQQKLEHSGFAADLATNLADADACLSTNQYDLIVLDRRLPDGTGLDLLRRLRAGTNYTPVILLTAADAIPDRVEGLAAGADDYIVKPFALEELVARIRNVLRRPGSALGVTLNTGNIVFNTQTREVGIAGRPVILPRRELGILECLMRAAGRVVTRDTLEAALYGQDDDRQSNVVESHVSRLRRHLESEGADHVIRVVRGVGYRLFSAPQENPRAARQSEQGGR
jgi:DNA-binding response OmpR family regulator